MNLTRLPDAVRHALRPIPDPVRFQLERRSPDGARRHDA